MADIVDQAGAGRRRRAGVAHAVLILLVLALVATGLVVTFNHSPSKATRLPDLGSASGADEIASLLNAAGRRSGLTAEEAEATTAVDAELSTAAGRQALVTAGRALSGHVFASAEPASGVAAATTAQTATMRLAANSSDDVRVYFVNGINNPYAEALVQRDRLAALLHEPVTLVYNSSWLDLLTANVDACTRALQESGIADEQVALDQSWSSWLAQKSSNAVAAGLKAACAGIDLTATAGVKALSVGHAVVSLAEMVAQRVTGTDLASAQVNSVLVPQIEEDIRQGHRVVLLSHSQGTMFARNALQQAQAWWAEQQATGKAAGSCPGWSTDEAIQASRPVPMANLYISPAFGSAVDSGATANDDLDHGAERYVMMRGDVLFAISPLPPTVDPAPGQMDTSAVLAPITAHKLFTYLHDPSASRTQIIDKFGSLVDYVTGLPGIGGGCGATTTTGAPTTTEPTTTTEASTTTEPPTSVLAGPDQRFTGGFAPPDPNNNPGHVKFLTNTITITVHADGSADGSYSISYTMNDTYLTPDVLPGCVETFSASGTLHLDAEAGGTGKILNLSEAAPTASGCWPNWSWSGRSQGGWRLNSIENGHALGGVDVYGQAFPYSIPLG